MIQYAIFDMDGLLIDSEPVWMVTQRAVVLELYGVTLNDEELLAFRGRTRSDFVEAMVSRLCDRIVDTHALHEALIMRTTPAVIEAPLMPGARELLDWLSDCHVPVAIASSSAMQLIESVVQRHELPVRVLVSGTEVPRSKPHPAVFELAAKRLKAHPQHCRVWEDSVNGVIAGRAAGMEVIAVPEPKAFASPQFSIAHRVHQSLHQSLAELKQSETRTL